MSRNSVHHVYQRGFSLVELMVAVTIGLIILAAVSGIFVSSKSTYQTTDSLARLQENARFAVHYLSRDIRMAAYTGCNKDPSKIFSSLNTSTYAFQNMSNRIEGLNDATGTWYPSASVTLPTGIKSGTDAITLRLSEDIGVSLTTAMGNKSIPLAVSSVADLAVGQIVMLSDCSSADIMQITGITGLSVQHATGGTAVPGNLTQDLYKQYTSSAKLLKFFTRTYFITTRALDNVPVLMMQENGGTPQELIEGVEDMQILYGKDTDATPDGAPNVYLRAGQAGLTTPSDWSRVQTIRIGLLVRTVAGKEEYTNSETYDVLGKSVTAPGDRHHRRVFTFTLQVRNQFPNTVPI